MRTEAIFLNSHKFLTLPGAVPGIPMQDSSILLLQLGKNFSSENESEIA